MISERAIGISILAVLLGIIALASVAMRRQPLVEQIATDDLPNCSTCVDGMEPSPEQCLASGGAVQYRRTNECSAEPSVYDACGFGVPCFTSRDGVVCRDVKDPYCHCEADDQCPESYYCQFDSRLKDGTTFEPILSTGQCWRDSQNSKEPVGVLNAAPVL